MADEPDRAGLPATMRASDADREKVAKALRVAMSEGRLDVTELDERLATVYRAKTIGELTPVTADLPGMARLAGPTHATPNEVTHGDTGTSVSVAVMGGVDRRGAWTVAAHHTAVAFMGGMELDLSAARLGAEHVTIVCVAFMGGIEVRVPNGIDVEVSGFGFMGSFDDRIREPARSGQPRPRVKVTGVAFMGGVEVKRPRGGDGRRVDN